MKRILGSLIVIAVVASTITMGAMALWTDAETSASNTYTTGTLDIALTNGSPLPFNVSAMAPGDNVTGTLVVRNSGTLQLRYAMTTTGDATSTLDEQLDCVIRVGATTVYNGKLSSAIIGDVTQGQQAGDRTLGAGTNETLPYTVSLPMSTPNAYQGTTATVSFTFTAEQTANNP